MEPMAIDAIVEAALKRALDGPDPLRGRIAALLARYAAAFVLDTDDVTRARPHTPPGLAPKNGVDGRARRVNSGSSPTHTRPRPSGRPRGGVTTMLRREARHARRATASPAL